MGRFLKKLFKKIEKVIEPETQHSARDEFEAKKRELTWASFFFRILTLVYSTPIFNIIADSLKNDIRMISGCEDAQTSKFFLVLWSSFTVMLTN